MIIENDVEMDGEGLLLIIIHFCRILRLKKNYKFDGFDGTQWFFNIFNFLTIFASFWCFFKNIMDLTVFKNYFNPLPTLLDLTY